MLKYAFLLQEEKYLSSTKPLSHSYLRTYVCTYIRQLNVHNMYIPMEVENA